MMLHSMKLCADKLNGITATPPDSAALPGAVLVVNTTTALPTPVAIANANSGGAISDKNNLNSTLINTSTIASIGNNSNVNNSAIVQRQLHQHQGKYLDAPGATKFHPYLRPAAVVASENSGSSTTVAGTSAFAATLFPPFLNSVNTNATTNKTPGTTTVAAVNTATSPSGLLTLPTKQPTSVSTANATTAGAFINSNSTYGNGNNYSAVHLKSGNMSDGEETNDSQKNTNELNHTDETFTAPMTDDCSNLISVSNHSNGDSNNVDIITGAKEFEKDQPDPDNIKMFVGQIPKSWDEMQLRKMFEQYGRVHTLNILRDKVTSVSRGCCFVTYYTRKAALKAQDALHNIKTLEGMHHPIQMKPADSENRNERKLFVGMLNKKYNEADVRQLFTGHGTIEECTVLRDQNGQSKGCAFVTFATKHNAIGAIKALHQSRTMEGCSAPLVVKFADTQKEKDQKKMQQLQASIVGITALTSPTTGAIAGLASTPSNGLSSATAAVGLVPSSITATGARSSSSMPTALAAVTNPQPTAVANSASALVPTSAAIPMSPSLLTAAGSAQQTSPYLATTDAMNVSAAQLQIFQQLQAFGLHPAQYLQGSGGEHLTSPYASTLSPLINGAAFPTSASPLTPTALQAAAAGVAGKQVEGPEGSNLFIYHLPQEFTDTDLASTFLPFGNVLSAKVFIDKQTNLSKCFGFVSYDNPHSANAAIQAMHGFQIGTKRLKVQLKRSKDAAKPY
ncbi:CUGBP Elav-like family member 2 isoform X2 [Anastrepha obliqua]|uniref:CUGBP Elav-like family member 2 isoform X2 n=1 Tax=Anastrepha obliqua TaxID=95512 RepID=UPI00240A4D82|nr:CUGBP Elav-like family member 2 isoform X2 [Anastrepha obliqua]